MAQMVKHLPAMRETWVGKILWRRKWQPTAVLFPGKSHGQRNLVGYSPLSSTVQRVGHNWVTSLSFKAFKFIMWVARRKVVNSFVFSSNKLPCKDLLLLATQNDNILRMCTVPQLCPTLATPWTVACQTPLSMGLSKQEYYGGLPVPPPGGLPDPGIKPISPASPALASKFFNTEPPGKFHLKDGRYIRGHQLNRSLMQKFLP